MEDEVTRRLMQDLQPHSNLKRLEVNGYNGIKMLSWTTLLPNIVQLRLVDCGELRYLPWLGNFQHLETFQLLNLANLEYVEEDSPLAYSNSNPLSLPAERLSVFTSLREIQFCNLPKLKRWSRQLAGIGDDNLRQLIFVDSNSSNSSKTRLQLLPCLSQLESLHIENCSSLTCIPQCPKLEYMCI